MVIHLLDMHVLTAAIALVCLSAYGYADLIQIDGAIDHVVDPVSNMHYNFFYETKKAWSQAREHCANYTIGGQLAVINSKAVHRLFKRYIKSEPTLKTPKGYWIGANDIENEGFFVFTDGSELTYQNGWHQQVVGGKSISQPNNNNAKSPDGQDCVQLWKHPRSKPKWNFDDSYCFRRLAYICEYSPVEIQQTTTSEAPAIPKYEVYYESKSFWEAMTACTDNGQSAAAIRDQSDQDQAVDAILNSGGDFASLPGFWIGVWLIEGENPGEFDHIYLADETPITYDNFRTDEIVTGLERSVQISTEETESGDRLWEWTHEHPSLGGGRGYICEITTP